MRTSGLGLMLVGLIPLPSPPRVPSPETPVPASPRVILPPPLPDLDDVAPLPAMPWERDYEPEGVL